MVANTDCPVAIFACVNDKPRVVEEHDGWSGVFSAASAGTGVALTSEVFDYAFNDRVKLVRLTPDPKRIAIGTITRKGKLTPATENSASARKKPWAGNARFFIVAREGPAASLGACPPEYHVADYWAAKAACIRSAGRQLGRDAEQPKSSSIGCRGLRSMRQSSA
jgi:hypothetical protein